MFKLTFNFGHSASRAGGWSESWITLKDTLSDAEALCRKMQPLYKDLHGDQSLLSDCRLHNLNTKRGGKPVRFHPLLPSVLNPDTMTDQVKTALRLETVGEDGGIVGQDFRGIPDSVIASGGTMVVTADYAKKFEKFRKFISDTNNGFVQLIFDPAAVEKEVTALTNAGAISVRAHGLAGAGKIRLTGIKSPKLANRDWKYSVVDTDTLALKRYPLQAAAGLLGDAKIRVVNFVPIAIVDAQLAYETSGRVGAPKNALGGSRKRK